MKATQRLAIALLTESMAHRGYDIKVRERTAISQERVAKFG
jgi:hypothetical protein